MQESVVFFGSGPVAARSLELLAHNFAVETVITKPATIQEMTAAAPGGTPIHAVSNKRELDELIRSKSFKSRLAILIDFGIIVSREVIDAFPLGIINSHFSVLPEWRGADPISFAILSGQPKTGVSLMLLDEGMDTGKILVTKTITVDPQETTPSLTNKLILLSNSLLSENVPKYVAGDIKPRQQSHPDRATYSRKLTKDDGLIDWAKPAIVLEREIRAFIEWPKSRTELGGKEVIITAAHAVPGNNTELQSGDIEKSLLTDKIIMIETSDGRLCIDTLKPAGKKEMTAAAFLAGYRHLL